MRNILSRLTLCATTAALVAAFGIGAAPAPAQQVSGTTAAPAAAPSASDQLARMTMGQRVGQLFMVAADANGASAATLSALSNYHVGNAYLAGRSTAGTGATAAVVRRLTQRVSPGTTGNVKLLVGTDQEGGYVQVLSGPGFSTIPTGLSQGTQAPATLHANALAWGRQLAAAGVNLNLAPVLDTVPSAAFAPSNAPIGYYEREYGYTPQTVTSHGLAFASGMTQANLVTAVKHFPGLGRVTTNTDTSRNVHDIVTTSHDPYLAPFQAAVSAGTGIVMVSSAYYDRIDAAHIGPFSATIMKTMLRGNLGFNGVILSDDLCNAQQLAPWTQATRATSFFNAGGSMLLCANPANIPAMYNAVLGQAQSNPAFRGVVNAAALKVLQLKAASIPEAFGPGSAGYATDFNADGTSDVIARDTAGNLYLYPGRGDGGWLSRVQIGYGWNIYNLVFSPGDFNGDGRADLLAGDGAGNLWFYAGTGNIGFLPRVQVGHGFQGLNMIAAAGDFNGDENADVLARDAAGNLWLYPGNGHGGWLRAVQVGHGFQGFNTIFSPGDFNGDGHADVMARDGGGNLWLYPGNGRGGWLGVAQVGHGWQGLNKIFSPGDFNGDGHADVLARDAAGNLWLYPGNGRGGWLPSGKIGNGWQGFTIIF